jgi:hypothetical protein
MAKDEHNKAAEHHENAAKSHRAAAEHHGKGDHAKGKEHSANAQQHAQSATQHSDQAHSKSQQKKEPPFALVWQARLLPISRHIARIFDSARVEVDRCCPRHLSSAQACRLPGRAA